MVVSVVGGVVVLAVWGVAVGIVPVIALWAAGGVGGACGGVLDGGQGVAVGEHFEDAVRKALAVVADLVWGAVAAAVLAPQGVVVVLDCLEHQREADRVESGVEHTHAGGLVDEQRSRAVAALAVQRGPDGVRVVAGHERLGVAAQHLRRDLGSGFEEVCGGVDGFGTGLACGVGEHGGMFGGELAHCEAACHIGHLGNLLADLDSALRVAGAHTRLVSQHRAARTRTRSFQRGGSAQQQRFCRRTQPSARGDDLSERFAARIAQRHPRRPGDHVTRPAQHRQHRLDRKHGLHRLDWQRHRLNRLDRKRQPGRRSHSNVAHRHGARRHSRRHVTANACALHERHRKHTV